ncbi:hypothetical protein Hanom_Chr17g01558761 [Helianthus anomalus]
MLGGAVVARQNSVSFIRCQVTIGAMQVLYKRRGEGRACYQVLLICEGCMAVGSEMERVYGSRYRNGAVGSIQIWCL